MTTQTHLLKNAPTDLASLGINDFWTWAFSDLCDDGIKGIFAEWIVIRLLGHETTRRVSWANSDIILCCGLRVEIKATAFWQSWKFVGEDGLMKPENERFRIANDRDIKFSRLKSRNSVGLVAPNETARYKSDIYVFCLQAEKDLTLWDALDLSQWEFYFLTRVDLASMNTSSISLAKLRNLRPPTLASDFKQSFDAIVTQYKSTEVVPPNGP